MFKKGEVEKHFEKENDFSPPLSANGVNSSLWNHYHRHHHHHHHFLLFFPQLYQKHTHKSNHPFSPQIAAVKNGALLKKEEGANYNWLFSPQFNISLFEIQKWKQVAFKNNGNICNYFPNELSTFYLIMSLLTLFFSFLGNENRIELQVGYNWNPLGNNETCNLRREG